MLNDLAILKNASAMANHAARRHNVIAQNIANADTPGFKAKDVKSFDQIYKQAVRENQDVKTMVQTERLIELDSPASPDGNSVSLEGQMLRSAEAVADHEMALTIYRKTMDMMKLAIGKNM